MLKTILVGAVLGAAAGWLMGSPKGAPNIAKMLKARGVIR